MWKTEMVKRLESEAGFGLSEVLVASTLGALIVAGFVAFNHFQLHALHDQVSQIELQTIDRDVVDLFAREVRRAGGDPTCAGTVTGIVEAAERRIRIQSDLNGNGIVDNDQNEDVTYRHNAATNAFERLANGATEVLLSGLLLEGSGIYYYDAAGTQLVGNPFLTEAQRNSVRRIRLQLSLTNRGMNSGAQLKAAASTDVNLRNRYFIANTACP
jgi:type II secretory pathway component PulJ